MPRIVRNFWIETNSDARKSTIGTGPKRKDGGFETVVYMRDKGQVVCAMRLMGVANTDGSLTLRVYQDGKVIATVNTDRDVPVKPKPVKPKSPRKGKPKSNGKGEDKSPLFVVLARPKGYRGSGGGLASYPVRRACITYAEALRVCDELGNADGPNEASDLWSLDKYSPTGLGALFRRVEFGKLTFEN